MNLTWRYLADLVERTVRTFVQAYLGYWVTLGGAAYDTLFTINNLKVAVAAAAMSVATALLSKGVGNPTSASVLPPAAQPPAPLAPESVPAPTVGWADDKQVAELVELLKRVEPVAAPPPPPPPGRVNPPRPMKPPTLSDLPPQGGPGADRRMTREQLDQIGSLYGRVGRPWHVADPAAMMEAISYQEAASLIVELQGKPLEQQLDRGATARGAAQ